MMLPPVHYQNTARNREHAYRERVKTYRALRLAEESGASEPRLMRLNEAAMDAQSLYACWVEAELASARQGNTPPISFPVLRWPPTTAEGDL